MAWKPSLTIVVDPRFAGGTSSAVAQEIWALHKDVDLTICAMETKMFKGRVVNPRLQDVLDRTGVEIVWNPPMIRGRHVVIHNPSAWKFDRCFGARILADRISVVTHENFVRPNGYEGFDVAHCLSLIAASAMSRRRMLVPVSPYNRDTIVRWGRAEQLGWPVADWCWFNICDFANKPPTFQPRDRRGRLSRPGFEKFPKMADMQRLFPAHAHSNIILGGDSFLLDPEGIPSHWTVVPFGGMDVDDCFAEMDFFVYFTHPNWRESFGRVIAEAIAAGKVVLTDAGTAAVFGPAVIACEVDDVDAVIAAFLHDPDAYVAHVTAAQAYMARFTSGAFLEQFRRISAEQGS